MKKAKEAAAEVIQALPLADNQDVTSVNEAQAAARVLADVYLGELSDELSAKLEPERAKRTEQGLTSIVREFEARWKGFFHRINTAAPEVFPAAPGQFQSKVTPVIGETLAKATWAPNKPKAAEDAPAGKGKNKGKGKGRADNRRQASKPAAVAATA